MVRSGESPRNATVSVRTPNAGFYFILKPKIIIEKGLNLTILEGYLTTGVPADVLANELDEMAFDYAAATINLLRTDADASPHDHVVNFIYYLKDLRDTLRQCVES